MKDKAIEEILEFAKKRFVGADLSKVESALNGIECNRFYVGQKVVFSTGNGQDSSNGRFERTRNDGRFVDFNTGKAWENCTPAKDDVSLPAWVKIDFTGVINPTNGENICIVLSKEGEVRSSLHSGLFVEEDTDDVYALIKLPCYL